MSTMKRSGSDKSLQGNGIGMSCRKDYCLYKCVAGKVLWFRDAVWQLFRASETLSGKRLSERYWGTGTISSLWEMGPPGEDCGTCGGW
jgi:hypothetical protein